MVTDNEMKLTYLTELEMHLMLEPPRKREILNDLLEQINDEEREGRNVEAILERLGKPEALAKTLNENYFEQQPKYFEYKSNWASTFPFVHIVIASKHFNESVSRVELPVARGIFAFGRRAEGIIAVGLLTKGLLSIGLVSFGLVTLGVLSCGLLAIGPLAVGGVAIGSLAVGIGVVGNLLLGYAAFGNIAIGKYVLGNWVSGDLALSMGNDPSLKTIHQFLGRMLDAGQKNIFVTCFYKLQRQLLEKPLAFILIMFLGIFGLGIICYIYGKNLKKVIPV